jgi:amino acid adenylation domain-containing protein
MDNLTDVYRLSPLQQGMLFHTLQDGAAGAYIELTTCVLAGDVDGRAMREAWQQIVSRHDALRAAFLWEGLDEPLQVIRGKVDLPWIEYDWCNLTGDEQASELKHFLRTERQQGFNLAQAPLMRFSFIKIGPDKFRLVWAHHHLLFDGWSSGILLREFFSCYDDIRLGRSVLLPEAEPYRRFIKWLQTRDRNEAARFWRSYLQGFAEPTHLRADALLLKDSPRNVEVFPFEMDRWELETVHQFSRDYRLTINTLVQAAWAFVLSRWAAKRDIVFGCTVSGRSPELHNAGSIVGLLINTLPVRIDARSQQPMIKWLTAIQSNQLDLEAFGYPSLTDIHGWSDVPRSLPLFESLLVFENQPVSQALHNHLSRIEIQESEGYEQTNYPLNLVAGQIESQLVLKFIYDSERFAYPEMEQLAGWFRAALVRIPDARNAASLSIVSPSEREAVLVRWNGTQTKFPRYCCIHELFEAQASRLPDAPAAEYATETISYRELNERADALACELRRWTATAGGIVGIHLDRSIDLIVGFIAVLKAGAAYLPLDPTYPLERLAFMIQDSRARVIITRRDVAGMSGLQQLASCPALIFIDDRALSVNAEPATGSISLVTPGEQLQPRIDGAQFGEGPIPRYANTSLHSVAGVEDEHEVPNAERQTPNAERRTPNAERKAPSEDAAYIIYTSGSTGEPKGVVVPHRAVVKLVWDTNYIELGPDDRIAQAANASFDAITFEIWGALLNGGCVVGIPQETILSPSAMASRFLEKRITTIFLTTALFQQIAQEIPDAFRSLRHVLFGGEAVDPRWAREVIRQGRPERLLHVYGPTECTTFATWHLIEEVPVGAKTIPIGYPLSNTTCYVLDEHLLPVGIGMPGELFIGGDGVACAYRNAPDLTAARFLPDAFSGHANARLYRTGDIVRRLVDGTIEFLGRRDHQLKIRGFRVELGEIEAQLRTISGVQDAVVIMRTDCPGGRLVAYVTAQAGRTLDAVRLRAEISKRLPAYMIPAVFMVVPVFPLTANGKLNRQALPAPEEGIDEISYVIPLNGQEEILAGIWAHVLCVEKVGRYDNFFERGGHSLLATRLISRVRDTFNISVPIRWLFDYPTLAEFSNALAARGSESNSAPPLLPVSRDVALPLSFAQERLWFLNQLEPDNPFYNIPLALRLVGDVKKFALQQALNELVQRHESLRTTFRPTDGQAVQSIASSLPISIGLLDLTVLSSTEQEAEARRLADADARKAFDLSRGPLLRAQLLQLGPEENVLLLSLHHIVSDGWSMGILTRDLCELYHAACEHRIPSLPELTVQYADFAAWQRSWLSGETLARQLSYWKTQLNGAPPVLNLPTDYPRPAAQSFRGKIETFEIEATLAKNLRELSNESGSTLFMTLLAGFAVLLTRYSNQTDLVIGSPIANRTRSEIEPLIGFFVNTLALRISLQDEPTFADLLGRVRRVALDAYNHQDLPFERLVDELQAERDLSRNPLFQVMFTLHNAETHQYSFKGLKIEPIKTEAVSAQFDLVLDIWEKGSALVGVLEYSTDLFRRETVVRMMRHYCAILAQMVSDPSQTVSKVSLLDANERKVLLDTFNPIQRQYPDDRLLHELFEEQASASPGAVAIIDDHSRLTYEDLNANANRIAHLLHRRGGQHEQFVGILDDRSCRFLSAMLGVLKAGRAFLPLDPAYPEDRIRYMIADSGISTLITRRSVIEKFLPFLSATQLRCIIDVEGDGQPEALPSSLSWYGSEDVIECSTTNLGVRHNSKEVAYLLYTSGSAGSPKGAMIRHDGAVNHIFAEADLLSLDRNLTFLQSAPASSDVSVWQFLAPVIFGGRCIVANFDTVCDPALLFDRIRTQRVSLIELVPVVLRGLLDHLGSLPAEERKLPDLKCAMVTGEAAAVGLINCWLTRCPGIPIINAYGPTEAADDVSQYQVTGLLPSDLPNVPIGRPLPNVWLYVLDRHLNLVPVGVPGEICVSGVAVGNGYWAAPEQTRERFVSNPYAGRRRGRVLYRTGDLGRWQPDGTIEFLGRLDGQIKLRGFRVELGEIEAALTRDPVVREAVVVASVDNSGETTLTAFVVPYPDSGVLDLDSERSMEHEQMQLWSDLHDRSYSSASLVDPTFDCVGWDSNYTGTQLPEADMQEYVDTAVDRILSLRPRRILEIGCGTGLLMFRLADKCEHYQGVDSSMAAINRLRDLQRSEDLCHRVPGFSAARFKCCRADEFEGLFDTDFDVAIFPSVVQYFPSLDYLHNVLCKLVSRLSPSGSIFLGDVRNLELLEAFHTSVQLFKADSGLPTKELRCRIKRSLVREQELCITPDYFRTLPQRISGVSAVKILPKAGRHLNEMTRFRYDVFIYLGNASQSSSGVRREKWNNRLWTEFTLNVKQGRRSQLAVNNAQSARVHSSLCAQRILWQPGVPETVGALRAMLDEVAGESLDPQEVWDLAEEYHYDAEIELSAGGEPGSFDVYLTPRKKGEQLQPAAETQFGKGAIIQHCNTATLRQPEFEHESEVPNGKRQTLAELANQPLREKFAQAFVPKLRSLLKAQLPGHMVPANFVIVDHLPLTPAGKVDRDALAEVYQEQHSNYQVSAEPETPAEQALAAIWRAVLGVNAVGRHDNFFDLGGHSLKATQVVGRIQKELGLSIPLREVFNSPTIADFAPLLDRSQKEKAQVISKIPSAAHYPVSHAQRRLWVLHQMDPKSAAYNMPSAVILDGPLDRSAFEQALNFVLKRHESFRTVFSSEHGEPRQSVRSDVKSELTLIDLTQAPAPFKCAQRLAEEEAHAPFDLERGPLFRLKLIRLPNEQHVFLATLHHIISDDWSASVIMRELAAAYAALLNGTTPDLPPLEIQYRDYAGWQNVLFASKVVDKHREYWLRHLQGELPVLELLTDRPRPAVKSDRGARVKFEWDAAISHRLSDFGRQRGSSLFMTLVGAVVCLLHRYTRQTDIIVGAPVAGRILPQLEDQVGFYVNTLALRHKVNPAASFEGFLEGATQMITSALEHQIYPFDQLVNELNVQRDVRRSPLFDIMVVLRNAGMEQVRLPDLNVRPFDYNLTTSQFDLTFSFESGLPNIRGEIIFNTDLFELSRVQRVADHLRTLIDGFLANPKERIDRLPLVSEDERGRLLSGNQGSRDVVPTTTGDVIQRFEARVTETPESVAVILDGQVLTYQELNSRANQLAHRLRKLGISRGDRIGLLVPRSAETVVSVLGILKTGAAYVPFDTDYPLDRVTFMASDAGISVLVTHPSFSEMLAMLPPQFRRLDVTDTTLELESTENANQNLQPSDAAYIIYTSGSTGKPKGVLITHGNLIRLFDRCQPWFGFNANDVWTLFHSIAFDFSVWELWGALLYGGRVVVVPYWVTRSPSELLHLLTHHGVTVLSQTPSAFRHLAAADEIENAPLKLRYVVFGGEALELESLRPWFIRRGDLHPLLVNMYGITETTVHVTYRPLSVADLDQNASVIGEPIPDLELYLLDEQLELVPNGAAGEIHVGGPGVARGYLNRPELTAERFVPSPFGREKGARLYKSGDLARRLETGDLEYLGRIDQQVKVRGFRIELGEIESRISAHPGIAGARVVPSKHAGEIRLAAYVLRNAATAVTGDELRVYLRTLLPEYMVPSSFIFLDQFPLTPHGKLDIAALPPPIEAREIPGNGGVPQNDIEKALAVIWRELLGVEQAGTQDNIFDLGAHSLTVIQAQKRMSECGWSLTVLDLFRYPTIESLAHFLSGTATSIDSVLTDAEDRAARRRNGLERARAQISE